MRESQKRVCTALACLALFIFLSFFAGMAEAKLVFNSRTGTIDFSTAVVERARFGAGVKFWAGATGCGMQGGGC